MYTCKDCIYYSSLRRKGGLGYCRRFDKVVSPYDMKCKEFYRKRVGGR